MKRTLFFIFYTAGLAGLSGLAAQTAEESTPTLITSQHLEMQGSADRNYFYFSGDVEVTGTNLKILCDELTVTSLREGPDGATIGTIRAIESIVARGSVEIHQAGRSAYAGRAEVDPKAGTVVLSDQPRIVDGEVAVEGYQFILNKGERKFVSVPDPNAPASAPSRSVVRLGAMPDLGFNQEEANITVDDQIQASGPAEPSEGAPSQPGDPAQPDKPAPGTRP